MMFHTTPSTSLGQCKRGIVHHIQNYSIDQPLYNCLDLRFGPVITSQLEKIRKQYDSEEYEASSFGMGPFDGIEAAHWKWCSNLNQCQPDPCVLLVHCPHLHKTNRVERNTTMQYIHGGVCNDENSTTADSRLVHTEPWCAGACNTHIHPIEKRGTWHTVCWMLSWPHFRQ